MKLQELAYKIEQRFNESELEDLCFTWLDIDYKDLPGSTRKDKIRELVRFCERHDRLDELVSSCQRLRPDESWEFDEPFLNLPNLTTNDAISGTTVDRLDKPSLNLPNLTQLNRLWIIGLVIALSLIIGLIIFLPSFEKEADSEVSSTQIADASRIPTPNSTDSSTVAPTSVPVEKPTNLPVETPSPTQTPAPPTMALTPQQLDFIIGTDDQADQIRITTHPVEGLGGLVSVCLDMASSTSGWWKGIGFYNDTAPNIEGEKIEGNIELPKCETIEPANLTVRYWKAKELGKHTLVGTRPLNLSQYGDHEVRFTWVED